MSTEDYQNLPISIGVAVTSAVKPQPSDPWAGACLETCGLQIRIRLSIASNPGLFRAEKQGRVSTEAYQNPVVGYVGRIGSDCHHNDLFF